MFTLFSRTDTPPFPPSAYSSQPPLLHFGKLPAVTHVNFFQTAYNLTSRRCVIARAVSANTTWDLVICSNHWDLIWDQKPEFNAKYVLISSSLTKFYHYNRCRVFQPAFGCWAHSKAGQNTCLAIFNLFCRFQMFFSDFSSENKKKHMKKHMKKQDHKLHVQIRGRYIKS